MQSVYEFGYLYGVTSRPTCADANMYGHLWRKDAAKMIVVFATHILGRIPDTSRSCQFSDMSDMHPEYQKYAMLACQL